MNIDNKKALLKVNLASLIDHDDTPESEVGKAIDELKQFVDKQWAVAKERRKAKAAAKSLPQ